ncbi:hypothetical protein EDC01DRAFT_648878 [Geopyxis carbonaria]|nr:hypothetical protein EDC01DRAFT_648878 [Geopyxis carbonaria]
MPVIRNPFRKNAPPLLHNNTEPVVSRLSPAGSVENISRTSTPAAESTSAISIAKNDDKNSYKMSVVNDSGVYLPPSPTADKKGFWKRSESSHSSKNRPPVSPSDEPFTIPRESFDSYRRSFDISARSPVTDKMPGRASMEARPLVRSSLDVRPSRMSLDVRPAGRMSLDSRSPRIPPVKDVEENEFEDVKLNDDPRPSRLNNIFHRFGDHGSKDQAGPTIRNSIFSRKGHTTESIHESELKSIQQGERE